MGAARRRAVKIFFCALLSGEMSLFLFFLLRQIHMCQLLTISGLSRASLHNNWEGVGSLAWVKISFLYCSERGDGQNRTVKTRSAEVTNRGNDG